MTDLEARYRRLFAAYPVDHRRQRENEMVTVLLDLAEPGQQRPSRRQAASIVANGLACRARSAEEWRLGLRLAGLASVGLATALATLILGIALLPPIAGPSWNETSGWVPVAIWSAALVATLAIPWMTRPGWCPPFAAMAALGVAIVWFGADVVGAARPLTGPFVVAAALASAGRAEPARRRVAASIGGLALGALLLWRFVERCRSAQWGARPSDTSFRLWTEIDRWILAYDAVDLRPEHAWTIVALGVVAGLVRPRFAVATGVLALPLTILTRQRYQFGRGDLPLQVASSLGAMLGLFGLALVVGRLRRWWTLGASDAPPAAHS